MNNQQTRNAVQAISTGTSASASTTTRGRRLLIAGATAAIVGSMSLIGVSHAQTDQKSVPTAQQKQERQGGKHERMNPEKRFERMVDRLVPDASAEQKNQTESHFRNGIQGFAPIA